MTEVVSPLTDAEYEVLSILAQGVRLLPLGDRIGKALVILAARGFVIGKLIPNYGKKTIELSDYSITDAGRKVIADAENQLMRDLIKENNEEYGRRHPELPEPDDAA